MDAWFGPDGYSALVGVDGGPKWSSVKLHSTLEEGKQPSRRFVVPGSRV
jgi:hypothetical protein